MKKIFANPIDFSKVETLVYHLPDGPSFSMEMHDAIRGDKAVIFAQNK